MPDTIDRSMWRRGVATLRRFIVAHPVPFATSVIGSSVFALTSVLGTDRARARHRSRHHPVVQGRRREQHDLGRRDRDRRRCVHPQRRGDRPAVLRGHDGGGQHGDAPPPDRRPLPRRAVVVPPRAHDRNAAGPRRQRRDGRVGGDQPAAVLDRAHAADRLLAHRALRDRSAAHVGRPRAVPGDVRAEPLLHAPGRAARADGAGARGRRVGDHARELRRRDGREDARAPGRRGRAAGRTPPTSCGWRASASARCGRCSNRRSTRSRTSPSSRCSRSAVGACRPARSRPAISCRRWRCSRCSRSRCGSSASCSRRCRVRWSRSIASTACSTRRPRRVPADPHALPSGPLDVEAVGLDYGYVAGRAGAAGLRRPDRAPARSSRSSARPVAARPRCANCSRASTGPSAAWCASAGSTSPRSRADDLRASVALVFQESFLFTDTIANNITIGPDGERTRRCAGRRASRRWQRFVDSLPAGYDTRDR